MCITINISSSIIFGNVEIIIIAYRFSVIRNVVQIMVKSKKISKQRINKKYGVYRYISICRKLENLIYI